MWWSRLVIPELWRLKEENQKFKVIFGYTRLSLSLKKKKKGRAEAEQYSVHFVLPS